MPKITNANNLDIHDEERLYNACKNGDLNTVTTMLETISVNIKVRSYEGISNTGYEFSSRDDVPGMRCTPLMIAIQFKQQKLIDFLLKQPEQINFSIEEQGLTPLHFALDFENRFKKANYELATTLIQSRADIDLRTSEDTLLFQAWSFKEPEVARKLVALGAKVQANKQYYDNLGKNWHTSDMDAQIEQTQAFVAAGNKPPTV